MTCIFVSPLFSRLAGAKHTRRMIMELRKHVEDPQLGSSLFFKTKKCAELHVEARMTCACSNFGPQKMGRKFKVCAHCNLAIAMDVPKPLEHAPWCVVHTS
jgi:hypothetical protein